MTSPDTINLLIKGRWLYMSKDLAKAAMILVALDDGHGKDTPGKRTPYIKSLGRQIQENEFNKEVVKYLDIELRRCGFKTVFTAPGDADAPLPNRVQIANSKGADLFISIHYNAVDGKFDGQGKDPEGFSAHVHSTLYNSAKFARIALKHLAEGTKQKNRGLVQQQLYVTANTKMPAVLFELGFMDNEREALLMLDKKFQMECAVELCKAVCEFHNVAYVASKPTTQKPAAKPAKKEELKGIGRVKILADKLNLRDKPDLNGKVIKEMHKGNEYNVYEIKGMWYRLSSVGWASIGSKKDYMKYTPHPKKPKPPVAKPKPEEKDDRPTNRVIIDGTQVGAFKNPDAVLDLVEEAIEKGKSDIRVEKKK